VVTSSHIFSSYDGQISDPTLPNVASITERSFVSRKVLRVT